MKRSQAECDYLFYSRWLFCCVLIEVLAIVGPANCETISGSSSTNLLVGSLVMEPPGTEQLPLRLVSSEQTSPDGVWDDLLALTYNEYMDPNFGLLHDDPDRHSVWLGLESWWNGSAELNMDIVPDNSPGMSRRPFGWNAFYDGSYAGFGVGWYGFGAGDAGVMLRGGHPRAIDPYGGLIDLYNGIDGSANDFLLQVNRADRTGNFNIRGGDTPRWLFGLDGRNINAEPTGYGILDFRGAWPAGAGGDPILYFEYAGAGAELIRSVELNTDMSSRFELWVDGLMNWGSGRAGVDTNLYRSAAGTLRTDGNLVVGGNLAVTGQKAALVTTASYGNREVYAIESPGEWFEDFGSAKLISAQTIVRLDPVFNETVNTGRDYHVFLTSNGRCTLYVANKAPTFFKVKLLRGSPVCRFDYRVIAKRRGYEDVRLAPIPNESAVAKD